MVRPATIKTNPPNKPWLVLKFGGTSIGKFLDTITEVIVHGLLENYRVALVCSALSSDCKQDGTTSRLLRAAQAVTASKQPSDGLPCSSASSTCSTSSSQSDQDDYHTIVRDIGEEHVKAARRHIRSRKGLAALITQIEAECTKLVSFLEAAEVIHEVSVRSRDIIIGTGERLACMLTAAVLSDRSIESQYVSLDRVVQRSFDATQLDQTFYDYLSKRMEVAVQACGDRVPVVTGFFGAVPGGVLNSIGRGYSDLTAALIAIGLKAKELQVWKEVDGVFTADPRKVPGARWLPFITPEEAAELTYYGCEVIHPFTMEQVIRAQIPIRIKNVQNPEGDGTVIFSDFSLLYDVEENEETLTKSTTKNANNSSHQHTDGSLCMPKIITPRILLENGYTPDMERRYPTAVTIKTDVAVINIHSNHKSASHGFLAQVFSILDRFGIVVDLISTSEVHVSMALCTHTSEHSIKKAVKSLSQLGTVDHLKDMAILSLVGKQMRYLVGIAGRMFNALADAGINIEMISQGASEINISCVVSRKLANQALNTIHEQLIAAQFQLEAGKDPDTLDFMGTENGAAIRRIG